MDDLTRERHPYPIPDWETRARPWPVGWVGSTPEQIAERRIVLCGVDGAGVLMNGELVDVAEWLVADQVLTDAIRRYAA